MSQTRLVDLARLNIESSIARQVDFDSVITKFANKNTRKSLIYSEMLFFPSFSLIRFYYEHFKVMFKKW